MRSTGRPAGCNAARIGLAVSVLAWVLVACSPDDPGMTAAPANVLRDGPTERPNPAPTALSPRDYPAPPTPTSVAPFAGPNGSRAFVQIDKTGEGYSVEVPAGWYVRDDGPGFVTLTSYDMSTVVGRGGVPSYLSKYDIWTDKVDPGQSLQEQVDSELSGEGEGGCEDREVLLREDWVLAGGESAIRYQVKCASFEYASLATRIGENAVHLVGYGDLAPFDAIARSLRAAP